MALTPTLSYVQRNDNKLLTFTDTTLNWGVGGNAVVTGVTVLTLDIKITTSNNTQITYDTIDLVDLFGDNAAPEFNDQAAMVFPITAAMLKVLTTPMGTSDMELPDGLWEITYTINSTVGTPETIFLDGRVRVAVYELLRTLPTIYNCGECKTKTVLDALYAYGCLNILRSDAYVAKTEELISLLYVLERIVTNGSNYTWQS
jgi:hypothetical protein